MKKHNFKFGDRCAYKYDKKLGFRATMMNPNCSNPKQALVLLDNQREPIFWEKEYLVKLVRKSKNKHAFPYLSMIVFEPNYAKEHPEQYNKSPIKLGEVVLYLGEIPNSYGHCAVVKHNGKTVWFMHSQDFRLATDEEI